MMLEYIFKELLDCGSSVILQFQSNSSFADLRNDGIVAIVDGESSISTKYRLTLEVQI